MQRLINSIKRTRMHLQIFDQKLIHIQTSKSRSFKKEFVKKKNSFVSTPPPPRGARLVRGSLPAAAAAGVSEESAVANIPHRLITAPSDNVNLVFLSARARRRVHGLVSGELTN